MISKSSIFQAAYSELNADTYHTNLHTWREHFVPFGTNNVATISYMDPNAVFSSANPLVERSPETKELEIDLNEELNLLNDVLDKQSENDSTLHALLAARTMNYSPKYFGKFNKTSMLPSGIEALSSNNHNKDYQSPASNTSDHSSVYNNCMDYTSQSQLTPLETPPLSPGTWPLTQLKVPTQAKSQPMQDELDIDVENELLSPTDPAAKVKPTRNHSSKNKRTRQTYTEHQKKNLEQLFAKNVYLNRQQREKLSYSIGLDEKQIKIWFQNRRMKAKKHTVRNAEADTEIAKAATKQPVPQHFPNDSVIPTNYNSFGYINQYNYTPYANQCYTYNPEHRLTQFYAEQQTEGSQATSLQQYAAHQQQQTQPQSVPQSTEQSLQYFYQQQQLQHQQYQQQQQQHSPSSQTQEQSLVQLHHQQQQQQQQQTHHLYYQQQQAQPHQQLQQQQQQQSSMQYQGEQYMPRYMPTAI